MRICNFTYCCNDFHDPIEAINTSVAMGTGFGGVVCLLAGRFYFTSSNPKLHTGYVLGFFITGIALEAALLTCCCWRFIFRPPSAYEKLKDANTNV